MKDFVANIADPKRSRLFASELIGTAFLFVGLLLVIFMFSIDSPTNAVR